MSLRNMLSAVLVVLLSSGLAAQTMPLRGDQAVAGVVQDQTGAVLPGASVELVDRAGSVVQTTRTDATGSFRFERVSPGPYQLRGAFEGFAPGAARLRVDANRPPAVQRIVLDLANLTDEITVSNGATRVDTAASHNLDAVTVDKAMLDGLPVLDQDVVAAASRFLDASAIGTGGVTIVVNGMEVSALRVSASAVQQIKINNDPYSAEYSRPGRGRIEILTKPGGREYHGELNLIGRDSRFDARNAFASTTPADRKHIVEGMLSGPLGGTKRAFVLSGHDNVEDQEAIVFAQTLGGLVQDVAPQPSRQLLLADSVTFQKSDATTIALRANYEYESSTNRGVGGTSLASVGTNFQHREEQITYTQQTIIHPTLVNQFQILVGHEREPTVSVSSLPGIVVAGAFTGGGGQGDLLRTETHAQMTESLAWTRGAHLIQGGFQLPDWSRRGFFDRTNAGGTFYFASLEAYAASQPYALTQQLGNGDVSFLEKQVGAYIKDDWQVRPGLTVAAGVRYDWQNYFHDNNNVSPRGSFAWSPRGRKTDVIRGGVGLFTDRSGPVVIADLLHALPGGLRRYVIENPPYPDGLSAVNTVAAAPQSTVRLAPDVQIPRTFQYSLGLEHQISKASTLSLNYTGARGYSLFRSRDVNAPLPPVFAARPDPGVGAIREVESNGRQHSDSLNVTLRGRPARWLNGQAQYTLSRVYNDTSGINAYPANDYDLASEWGRADFDRRHRLNLLGRVTGSKVVDLGVALSMNSAGPYSAILGADVYNNGRGKARPAGVGRNTLEGAGYASLDLRASHEITLGGPKSGRSITLGLDAFNVTNRVNPQSFVGIVGSPLFGMPVAAAPPRQLQFSARLTF